MAEKFIEELYKNAEIVYELEVIVEDIRLRSDTTAVSRLNDVFSRLAELSQNYIEINLDYGKIFWSKVKKISSITGDLTEIGDVIEIEILPRVREYLGILADINVDLNKNYSIMSTRSGFLTLYSKEKDIYIHSMDDPMMEARKYVSSLYDVSKDVYYVFGCGMGYELYQLYELSEGFTQIILYEPCEEIYTAAVSYGVLSKIPDDYLERCDFENVSEFMERAENSDAGILINIPSLHALEDNEEKRCLTSCWMMQNSARRFEKDNKNRIRNAMLNLPDAEVYLKDKCEEVVIVAAGPSLSEQINLLRDRRGRKIIAVGTIFHKLLSEGIKPDCVVMIDPKESMVEQIRGIEESEVPLLLDDNAYWKLARIYKGPTYFMKNWNYSGTVASAAIEVAAHMGATVFYLMGYDMAYPVLQSHADGATSMSELDMNRLFLTESTDGGKVLTDNHLSYYLTVIENQIKNHKEIKFINMSKHGAKINGTINWNGDANETVIA